MMEELVILAHSEYLGKAYSEHCCARFKGEHALQHVTYSIPWLQSGKRNGDSVCRLAWSPGRAGQKFYRNEGIFCRRAIEERCSSGRE